MALDVILIRLPSTNDRILKKLDVDKTARDVIEDQSTLLTIGIGNVVEQ